MNASVAQIDWLTRLAVQCGLDGYIADVAASKPHFLTGKKYDFIRDQDRRDHLLMLTAQAARCQMVEGMEVRGPQSKRRNPYISFDYSLGRYRPVRRAPTSEGSTP